MKMRQYIAITDHILWDIITNGNQTTTDPASPSVSAPKTSLAANARRNNEKALNILLSAIPDRHLLSFHDAGRTRFSIRKVTAYSLAAELHDYGVIEDANLKPAKIDEDAMEEIDIRWQVAMITARIRKFMRKTGRPIDLKPKNGITFDKSKIECFNCQKLGPIMLETLVATDNNEDIDWTKEFDLNAVTYAYMATDWRIDELAIRNKVVNQEKTKSSQSEIDRNKVIIEEMCYSDDEELMSSESPKETAFNSENSETIFLNRSPNSQNSVGQESRTKGLGNKGGKLCFVCYSPNHLIKDCNLHERTFKQTQTHKPKGTQGSRETRPVWNNIQRVNHSNFSRNSRYPHQRRSFTPSAVLTRDGLISTARPTMTQTVPSKSTANVTYQGLLSKGPSQTTRAPKKNFVKSICLKERKYCWSPNITSTNCQKECNDKSKQTWRPKGNYLDSVNKNNGSYTLKQFEYVTPFERGNPKEALNGLCLSLTVDALELLERMNVSAWIKRILFPLVESLFVAKAIEDEAVHEHRRLRHVNY
ncbi:hypothetical protein Tco_0514588 [Tanacetum coccineum]